MVCLTFKISHASHSSMYVEAILSISTSVANESKPKRKLINVELTTYNVVSDNGEDTNFVAIGENRYVCVDVWRSTLVYDESQIKLNICQRPLLLAFKWIRYGKWASALIHFSTKPGQPLWWKGKEKQIAYTRHIILRKFRAT